MGPDTATSPDVQNLATMALLFGAAVLGGALNAVAGGGSFIGFPALLFAGISPVAANATNTVALWPGSIASALEYRSELNRSRSELVVLSASSLVGGAAGALLLLHTRESTFVALIPWLLLVATVLFTAGPTLSARFPRAGGAPASPWGVAVAQLLIAVYGGYFGAGMGILILATLALAGLGNIHEMNGLKSILSSLINGAAVVLFVCAGAISWRPGSVMIAGGILGGFAGAWLARRVEPKKVRNFVVVVAWSMTLWFFVQPHLK